MTANFDFIQSYRDLDGSATREIIDLRLKSFDKLAPAVKTVNEIYDLCHIAFQIEPLASKDWFEAPLREFDPHFMFKKDKIDAGRMAALLLRQEVSKPGAHAPLAVLTTSYGGRRPSVDDNVLTQLANEAFHAAVRGHRVSNGVQLAAAPKFKSVAADLEQLAAHNPLPGTVAKTAIDAAAAASEAAVRALYENVRGPITSARSDITRLAEEVDMLWWCIGDWHELLGKPRADTAAGLKLVVSGIELGAMVRHLPGPFGAHGILRRIAGADADGKSSLKAAMKLLSEDDARKLSLKISEAALPLVPVHAAIQAVANFGSAGWEAEFGKIVPDLATARMSPAELGYQAFRERALLTHGGLR
ncbi:MAG: hypothetical protein JWL86_5330 [Rhizobium sp.]|nr:hypothetical protein [Rhizobium sp.]